jgi:RNA recognition motif-containing protein
MTKLFIVGIPRDMEEMELVELFSAYGQVATVTIVTDKENGTSKGFAFMEMTNEEGADRAIAAMDGATIDERKISVRIAEDKKDQRTKAFTTKNDISRNGPNYIKVEKETGPIKKKRPRKQF